MDRDEGRAGEKRRTRMAPAERRAMILSAAAQLFHERGYAATGIDAIAAAAGISGPAIYRYFARKTELLVALLEAAASDATAAMEHAMATRETANPLATMADVMVDHALREGPVIGLLHSHIREMDERDQAHLEAARRTLVTRWSSQLMALRPDLPEPTARIHIESALALVGHLARRTSTASEADRYRRIVKAVLAA